MVVEEKGTSDVAPFCSGLVASSMINSVPCFQSSTMAAISIGCSVPSCDFRTPEVPSHFYPNMVDQLKVMKWFLTEDILLL